MNHKRNRFALLQCTLAVWKISTVERLFMYAYSASEKAILPMSDVATKPVLWSICMEIAAYLPTIDKKHISGTISYGPLGAFCQLEMYNGVNHWLYYSRWKCYSRVMISLINLQQPTTWQHKRWCSDRNRRHRVQGYATRLYTASARRLQQQQQVHRIGCLRIRKSEYCATIISR